jgi:hypothetical protein
MIDIDGTLLNTHQHWLKRQWEYNFPESLPRSALKKLC